MHFFESTGWPLVLEILELLELFLNFLGTGIILEKVCFLG